MVPCWRIKLQSITEITWLILVRRTRFERACVQLAFSCFEDKRHTGAQSTFGTS